MCVARGVAMAPMLARLLLLQLLLACWLPSLFGVHSNLTLSVQSGRKVTLVDIAVDADDGGLLPVLPVPKHIRYSGSILYYPSLEGEVEVAVHVDGSLSPADGGHSLRMAELSAKRFVDKCRRREAAAKLRYPIAYFSRISVHIVEEESRLLTGDDLGHNETAAHSIHLDNPSRCVVIRAKTYHGILNAFATLAQLFASPLPLTLPLRIADWPENAWRGLLLDVARHFQPLPQLKRMVDGMEHSKMNVLHLHLSDSQSFPVLLNDTAELPLSQLALHSAFSRDKMYTLADLEDLVDYALRRGIEVVPEIDVPAHVRSWGAAPAFRGIVVNCSRTASAAQTPVNVYLINPTDPLAIKVIAAVIRQIAAVFTTSRYLHIGGDEVHFDCWREDETVAAELRARNATVESALRTFEAVVFALVRAVDKVPVVWQDSFDGHTLPAEGPSAGARAVVQPWKCWSGLAVRSAKAAAEGGYRVVVSACWYLDYEEDWTAYLVANALGLAKASGSQHGARGRGARRLIRDRGADAADATWTGGGGGSRCLTADSPVHSDYFLGGEGSMWTENVDHTNLECRIWPRAGAVAAKLWGYSPHLPQQRRSLSLPETKSLLTAVVVYRTFLCSQLGIKAADLEFHSPRSAPVTKGGATKNETALVSRTVNDVAAAVRLVAVDVKCAMTLPPSNDIAGPPASKCSRLTSNCLGIPEKIQRPYRLDRLKIGQLNVADGSTGGRGSSMLQWLQRKAAEGVMLIGLCELNGWEEMESTTNIMKNFPRMRFRAANAGFSHSFVMVNSQPYNIGLVSAVPFEVLGEYGPPRLQRGLLHVHYADQSLHVLIAHLHAHDSEARERECEFIGRLAKSISAGAGSGRVVLMGDLNTLSPLDAAQHAEEGLLRTLARTDHAVFARLGKKFLDSGRAAINYRPMQLLLDAGFKDTCVEMCLAQSGVNGSAGAWTLSGGDAVSRCMQRQCPFTEPTKYNPEWPELPDGLPHPRIRLDYILTLGGSEGIASALVDINSESERFSDHFPVFVDFVQDVHLF